MITEVLTDNEAVKGEDYPIEIKVYKEGIQLIPSSALITIKDPDGSAQVTDQSMAIESGVGTMTYTFPAANTIELWENAIIQVVYTVSSVDYKLIRLFDVVLNRLTPAITDDDLKNHFPDLADELWENVTTYNKQILEAFREVKRDLKNKGRRPVMLIDGSQLREIHITKTFEIIFKSFFKTTDDMWYLLYKEMQLNYSTQFDALIIKYDENEDGVIDSDEKERRAGSNWMER